MSKKNKGNVKTGLLIVLALVFVASIAKAYTVSRAVDASFTEIYLLDDSGNLTIAGAMTSATAVFSGAVSASDGLTVGGVVNLGTFAETVADAAVVTNEGHTAILTGTSGGTTNTIANPSASGEAFLLINNSAFPIVIADSGNVKLAGAVTLGEDDTIQLMSTSASEWVEVSRSDN